MKKLNTLQEWYDIQKEEYQKYLEERNQDIANPFLKGNRDEANKKKHDKRIALDKYRKSPNVLNLPDNMHKIAAGIKANNASRGRGAKTPMFSETYYKK
ncbi:MAG: hypothetical protein FWC41_02270 [Firmicutes bacterium]|nr:hypothetical protein [Bacillota bacterium]